MSTSVAVKASQERDTPHIPASSAACVSQRKARTGRPALASSASTSGPAQQRHAEEQIVVQQPLRPAGAAALALSASSAAVNAAGCNSSCCARKRCMASTSSGSARSVVSAWMRRAITPGQRSRQRCRISKLAQSIWKNRLRTGSCSVQLGWPSGRPGRAAGPARRAAAGRGRGHSATNWRMAAQGLRRINRPAARAALQQRCPSGRCAVPAPDPGARAGDRRSCRRAAPRHRPCSARGPARPSAGRRPIQPQQRASASGMASPTGTQASISTASRIGHAHDAFAGLHRFAYPLRRRIEQHHAVPGRCHAGAAQLLGQEACSARRSPILPANAASCACSADRPAPSGRTAGIRLRPCSAPVAPPAGGWRSGPRPG